MKHRFKHDSCVKHRRNPFRKPYTTLTFNALFRAIHHVLASSKASSASCSASSPLTCSSDLTETYESEHVDRARAPGSRGNKRIRAGKQSIALASVSYRTGNIVMKDTVKPERPTPRAMLDARGIHAISRAGLRLGVAGKGGYRLRREGKGKE